MKLTSTIMILTISLTLVLFVTSSSATGTHGNNDEDDQFFKLRDLRRQRLESSLASYADSSDLNNNLFSYDPLAAKKSGNDDDDFAARERRLNNVIRSNLFTIERESPFTVEVAKNIPKIIEEPVEESKDSPTVIVSASKGQDGTPLRKGSDINGDKIKSIAFNSREIRLVGPDQKEVEMKDDVATKIIVALENLQKEASDVWGTVNTKLDKGWTDLKTMVEGAVKPESKAAERKASGPQVVTSRQLREAPSKQSSLVVVSDVDGYSMADADEASKAAQQGAETTGSKIKGFFSSMGLNEENQKKANEALTKTGSAVSETVTKDIPDAFKKASDVVSDTVTKDIPDAFKNFFG